jgi:hypothetical protein
LSDFTNGYPKKTDILCWWCCHSFDTQPLGIPKRYNSLSESFTVLGCFCSCSCVYSYISSFPEHKKCSKSDIIFMYKKISGNKDLKISECDTLKKAPPKEVLKSFGGNMDIEQYRNLTKHQNVEMLLAPMTSLFLTCQTSDNTKEKYSLNFYQSSKKNVELEKTIVVKKEKKSVQKRSIGDLVSYV